MTKKPNKRHGQQQQVNAKRGRNREKEDGGLCEQEDLKQLRTQELRRQLQVGVEQLDRGASRVFDEGAAAEVKKAGRKRRDGK